MRFALLLSLTLCLPGCPKTSPRPGRDADSDSDTDVDIGDGGDDGGPTDAGNDVPERDGGEGFPLGQWELRFASLVYEPNYPGVPSAPLRTCSAALIKVVVADFADRLRIERRGLLDDGRIIQQDGNLDGGEPCYVVMDPAVAPWGLGSYARPLMPFRSAIVSPSLAGDGRWLYVPRLYGLAMPGDDRGLSFVHDGCVRVDDDRASGRIMHLWVALPSYGDRLEDLVGTEPVPVFQDSAYCD